MGRFNTLGRGNTVSIITNGKSLRLMITTRRLSVGRVGRGLRKHVLGTAMLVVLVWIMVTILRLLGSRRFSRAWKDVHFLMRVMLLTEDTSLVVE
jgi:hypothetical protein